MDKKLYIKTADGSVWEVLKELPNKYLVKAKFVWYIYKVNVVEQWYE